MSKPKKKARRDRIAKALGASRVVRVRGRKSGGPLDWLGERQAKPMNLPTVCENCGTNTMRAMWIDGACPVCGEKPRPAVEGRGA